MKILRCRHCGNIVFVLKESGVPLICCGEKMGELDASTRDGALEKHVPVYEVKDNEIYCCPECGNIIDRDYNAAINILNRGLTLIS